MSAPPLIVLDGYGPVPPLRNHLDLYVAHNLIHGVIDNRLNTGLVGMNVNYNALITRAETLCWALHHDTPDGPGDMFQQLLDTYARQMQAFTNARIEWHDTRRYTGGQR